MTPTSIFSQVAEGEEAGDNENTARLPERWMTSSGEVEERKMDNTEGGKYVMQEWSIKRVTES